VGTAVWSSKPIDVWIFDFSTPTAVFLRDGFAGGLTAWTAPYRSFPERMRGPFLDAEAMEDSPTGCARPDWFGSLYLAVSA